MDSVNTDEQTEVQGDVEDSEVVVHPDHEMEISEDLKEDNEVTEVEEYLDEKLVIGKDPNEEDKIKEANRELRKFETSLMKKEKANFPKALKHAKLIAISESNKAIKKHVTVEKELPMSDTTDTEATRSDTTENDTE